METYTFRGWRRILWRVLRNAWAYWTRASPTGPLVLPWWMRALQGLMPSSLLQLSRGLLRRFRLKLKEQTPKNKLLLPVKKNRSLQSSILSILPVLKGSRKPELLVNSWKKVFPLTKVSYALETSSLLWRLRVGKTSTFLIVIQS